MRSTTLRIALVAAVLAAFAGLLLLSSRGPTLPAPQAFAGEAEAERDEVDPAVASLEKVSVPVDVNEPVRVAVPEMDLSQLGAPPPRQSQITVTLASGSKSIPGLQVAAVEEGKITFPGGTISGRGGRVVLHSRAARTRLIRVSRPGEAWSAQFAVTFPFEGENRDVRLEVEGADESDSVRLEIVDEASGLPLEGVHVTVAADSGDVTEASTDARGRVTLPGSDREFKMSLDGYTGRSWRHQSEGGETQRVVLRRPARIEGVLATVMGSSVPTRVGLVTFRPEERKALEDGKLRTIQLSGFGDDLIQGAGRSASVDSAGHWAVPKLAVPYGFDHLELHSISVTGGGQSRTITVNLEVRPGETVVVEDPWASEPSRALRVLAGSGMQLRVGAAVTLADRSGSPRLTLPCGDDGLFQVGRVPARPWYVTAGLQRIGPIALSDTVTDIDLSDSRCLEIQVPKSLVSQKRSWLVIAKSGEEEARFSPSREGLVQLFGLPRNRRVELEVHPDLARWGGGRLLGRRHESIALYTAVLGPRTDEVRWKPVEDPRASRRLDSSGARK